MSETSEGAAPENAAPETPAEGVQPAQPQTAPQAPAVPEKPAEPAQDKPQQEAWWNTRIRQQTARIGALERELNGLRQPAPKEQATPTPAAPSSPDELQQLVRQGVANERLNEACDATYYAGKAAHPDFDDVVRNYFTFRDGGPPREFLEAVTSLDHGAEVYYALGKDPALAMRVFNMSPVRMAVELSKIESKLAAPKETPKQVSRAPAPVTPLGGSASEASPDLDDTADGDRWIQQRQKQVDARSKLRAVRR